MMAIAEYFRRFRKTPPALWLAVIVAVLVVASLVSHYVKADDAPPQTILLECLGPTPLNSVEHSCENGENTYQVNATGIHDPGAPPDYLSTESEGSFRHFYWKGGDRACLFTASIRPGAGMPFDIGGGRDMGPESAHHAAYIAEGWHVFATTGGSCSQVGVGLCSGIFCR